MGGRKRVALVGLDNWEAELLGSVRHNHSALGAHEPLATGTRGRLLSAEVGLAVSCSRSGRIDFVVFFRDPLVPHPASFDALLRSPCRGVV